MIDFNSLKDLAIVSVAVSSLIEAIKLRYGVASATTRLILIGLSVVVGLVGYFLQDTHFLEVAVSVAGIASLVYSFFWKFVETE